MLQRIGAAEASASMGVRSYAHVYIRARVCIRMRSRVCITVDRKYSTLKYACMPEEKKHVVEIILL